MNWKMTMNSYRFLLRKKVDGKTFSFTDHLSIADESKNWYITKAMKRYFDSENLEVVRVVGSNRFTPKLKVGLKEI